MRNIIPNRTTLTPRKLIDQPSIHRPKSHIPVLGSGLQVWNRQMVKHPSHLRRREVRIDNQPRPRPDIIRNSRIAQLIAYIGRAGGPAKQSRSRAGVLSYSPR